VLNLGVGFVENLSKLQIDRFEDGQQFTVILAGQCAEQSIRN
jgi:hypothetical protein